VHPRREPRRPGLADLREQRWREAPVDACPVHGGGDVEARADLALGRAVGGLGEVMEPRAALGGREGEVGRGEVVAQDGAGEGGHEGGRGAQAGLVGILETDAEVCELGSGSSGGARGLGIVVVVGEDGDGCGLDGGGGQDGRDVGQGVGQGGLYKGVS